ncbi:hypothetical protein CBM2637_A200500 [Cupriavidus taiwanensis]|nr:hypothetical protein CBM2637_A200500 [Cupriavidus taiwanensis]
MDWQGWVLSDRDSVGVDPVLIQVQQKPHRASSLGIEAKRRLWIRSGHFTLIETICSQIKVCCQTMGVRVFGTLQKKVLSIRDMRRRLAATQRKITAGASRAQRPN